MSAFLPPMRLTLHQAKERVADICAREHISPPGWAVRWDDPVKEAIRFAVLAEQSEFREHEKAAKEISAVLLAYRAHLDFVAGKAFSDAASICHARRMAAFHVADELAAGLHYAEEPHR